MATNLPETASAAKQDYLDGQLWWEGCEKEQDFDHALSCFIRAAKAGHSGAMNSLALLYFYAFDDDKSAYYWARHLGETGDELDAQASKQLLDRFSAPPLTQEDYYFRLRLEVSGYDHVVHSGLSCDWRNVIADARAFARRLANDLGLNTDKVEALAILKGRTQLPFGPAGIEYIKTLAKRDGITLDEYLLCLEIMRNTIAQPLNMRFRITRDLVGAIYCLYREGGAAAGDCKQNESRIVAGIYEDLQNSFVSTSSGLGDAEREYINIVWGHYREFGARGADFIRRVTSPVNQGEHVVDIRRLGRKTSGGKLIETYNGVEAPSDYVLQIRAQKSKSDIAYGENNTYEIQKEFPVTLNSNITLGSLTITIVELLSTEGEFIGAVVDVLCPTDARSTLLDEQRETLLINGEKQFAYGGGNDDFDISSSFIISIHKSTKQKSTKG